MRKRYRSSNISITNHFYPSPTVNVGNKRPTLADIANLATVATFCYPILVVLSLSILTVLPGDEVRSSTGKPASTRVDISASENQTGSRFTPSFPFLKQENPQPLTPNSLEYPSRILRAKETSRLNFASPGRKKQMPRCTGTDLMQFERSEDAIYSNHISGVTVSVARRSRIVGGFDVVRKGPRIAQSAFADNQTFTCWIGSPPPSTQ